jgi:hypothetical protein
MFSMPIGGTAVSIVARLCQLRHGNIQPSKLNSKLRRIDGTVALIIAYAVLNRYKTDYENMIG